MKTAELTGPALAWAVAKCEGKALSGDRRFKQMVHSGWGADGRDLGFIEYSPTTNWAQGGPIIEREGISIWPFDDVTWKAQNMFASGVDQEVFEGPTPLIAALRVYVASKLGDEVEIPEELK